MKYTLYIDESSDFESHKGNWVVAGMLFNADYVHCEKLFKQDLKDLPRCVGLKSIENFHLSELRAAQRDKDKTNELVRATFEIADSLPLNYHAVVAINHSKKSHTEIEKNYRIMLLDVISLCETVLADNETMDHLDIVVATRTKENKRLTSYSEINEDVIKSLPHALEFNLATRGIIDLMGKRLKVHMDRANNSWGLVFADFMANINYHHKKTLEKKFLSELTIANKYSVFESLGGHEHRRAAVAERDRDYVLALYRWLLIEDHQLLDKEPSDVILRLLDKLFNNLGTFGPNSSFETLLEKIWRAHASLRKYTELLSILQLLESYLTLYIASNDHRNFDYFIFRLRNMMLLVVNHIGNTRLAVNIAEKQNEHLSKIVTNPEHFQLVLDFKVSEIEICINSLDLEKASVLTRTYSELIANYKEVWKILLETEELEQFDHSKATIRSVMTQFRVDVCGLGIDDDIDDPNIEIKRMEIRNKLTSAQDISRLNNYQVMFLLKKEQPLTAIDLYTPRFKSKDHSKLSAFDFLWLMRATNDALLMNVNFDEKCISSIIQKNIKEIDGTVTGHPFDLVFREFALYESICGNKGTAQKYIRKARGAFHSGDSEMTCWLDSMLTLYDDYIQEDLKADESYFKQLEGSKFLSAVRESAKKSSFFERARYFSIY